MHLRICLLESYYWLFFEGVSVNCIIQGRATNDFLCEPFDQGLQNIQTAWMGRRVDNISGKLDILDRITHVAAGLILLIPIINILVFNILKELSSTFVFASRIGQFMNGLLNDPVAVDPRSDDDLDLQARVDGETLTHQAFVLPQEPPATAEEYARRKQACIDALNQAPYQGYDNQANAYEQALIEYRQQLRAHEHDPANPLPALPVPPNVPLACANSILAFNLDVILNMYDGDLDPIRLEEFYDFARVPASIQRELSLHLRVRYEDQRLGQQQRMAKELLSKLFDFLNQKKPLFVGTDRENPFKAQVRNIFIRIEDAHHNCVDQVNSQLEAIVIDTIANFDTGNGQAETLHDYLIQRAAYSDFQYRSNLIKEICLMEYPNEHHLADLERAVKQKIAEMLDLGAQVMNAGAILNFHNIEEMAENVANIFLNGRPMDLDRIPDPQNRIYQANPDKYIQQMRERQTASQCNAQQYLISNLRTPVAGNGRTLRNDMLIWARQYFHLEADDALTNQFIREISATPDELDASEGGPLKYGALLYYLDRIGILTPPAH